MLESYSLRPDGSLWHMIFDVVNNGVRGRCGVTVQRGLDSSYVDLPAYGDNTKKELEDILSELEIKYDHRNDGTTRINKDDLDKLWLYCKLYSKIVNLV